MNEPKLNQDDGVKRRVPLEANITLIIPKEDQPNNKFSDTKALEHFVTLVKALAWPILILFLFVVLRVPLTQTIELLPQKFSESTKFSVGSLSFEIQQSAKATGNPELANLIGGLSPKAVETLLKVGKTTTSLVSYSPDSQIYYLPDEEELDALAELENKKIVEFSPMPIAEFRKFPAALSLKKLENSTGYSPSRPLTANEEDALKKENRRLTEVGQKAFELIIQVVSQQLEKPFPTKERRE